MENFKIELFKNEHNIDFPNYVHLSEAECSLLIKKISKRYRMPIPSLIEQLVSKQSFIENINAKDDFHLKDFLNKLSVNPMSKIYINWSRFNNIDLLNIDDLDKYFDDIWFPSSDDIDLFDESLDWIVSIRHDGIISFMS